MTIKELKDRLDAAMASGKTKPDAKIRMYCEQLEEFRDIMLTGIDPNVIHIDFDDASKQRS